MTFAFRYRRMLQINTVFHKSHRHYENESSIIDCMLKDRLTEAVDELKQLKK